MQIYGEESHVLKTKRRSSSAFLCIIRPICFWFNYAYRMGL